MPQIGHFSSRSLFPAVADPETAGKPACPRREGGREGSEQTAFPLPCLLPPRASVLCQGGVLEEAWAAGRDSGPETVGSLLKMHSGPTPRSPGPGASMVRSPPNCLWDPLPKESHPNTQPGSRSPLSSSFPFCVCFTGGPDGVAGGPDSGFSADRRQPSPDPYSSPPLIFPQLSLAEGLY